MRDRERWGRNERGDRKERKRSLIKGLRERKGRLREVERNIEK